MAKLGNQRKMPKKSELVAKKYTQSGSLKHTTVM